MKNGNPLYLFVGKSSSGKTTIARMLEDRYGHKQVQSYTTRPPRYDDEYGHVFVAEDEFKNLGELAAYTFYNNHHYGTTFQQLDECDIYVIDPPGIKYLLEKIRPDKHVEIIYFDAAVSTRIDRMVERGDSDLGIIKRLHHDDTIEDWYDTLYDIVWHYNHMHEPDRDVELNVINANEDIENVLEQVLFYMNKNLWE